MNAATTHRSVDFAVRLFTAIGHFRTVPFITQHEALTPEGAVKAWLESFPLDGLSNDLHLKPGDQEAIRRTLSTAVPSRNASFRSWWEVAFMVERDVFRLAIVDTKIPDAV